MCLAVVVEAVVEMNLAQHTETLVQQFEATVLAQPAIVRCVSTTGQRDDVLTVLAPDTKRDEAFLHLVLLKLPGVTHLR